MSEFPQGSFSVWFSDDRGWSGAIMLFTRSWVPPLFHKYYVFLYWLFHGVKQMFSGAVCEGTRIWQGAAVKVRRRGSRNWRWLRTYIAHKRYLKRRTLHTTIFSVSLVTLFPVINHQISAIVDGLSVVRTLVCHGTLTHGSWPEFQAEPEVVYTMSTTTMLMWMLETTFGVKTDHVRYSTSENLISFDSLFLFRLKLNFWLRKVS